MIVAFIEPDKYERTTETTARLRDVIRNLVVNDGARVFLFANAGFFDNDCYTIVSQLKAQHPYIERHYFHGGCDYDVGYVDWMANHYDKVHFPTKGVARPDYLRNSVMIDKCDTLVSHGAVSAVEYARRKQKRVIIV